MSNQVPAFDRNRGNLVANPGQFGHRVDEPNSLPLVDPGAPWKPGDHYRLVSGLASRWSAHWPCLDPDEVLAVAEEAACSGAASIAESEVWLAGRADGSIPPPRDRCWQCGDEVEGPQAVHQECDRCSQGGWCRMCDHEADRCTVADCGYCDAVDAALG